MIQNGNIQMLMLQMLQSSGFKALPRNKHNDILVETKDHFSDHNLQIFEVLLKEVQELRREVNDIRKSK